MDHYTMDIQYVDILSGENLGANMILIYWLVRSCNRKVTDGVNRVGEGVSLCTPPGIST